MDIRNLGNEPYFHVVDNRNIGSINYKYRIGTFEVTIDQFAKVRAADSRIGDGDEGYWNDGIRTEGIDAPATYVNWLEAAMFANWLTTGDAYEGAYQFDTNGTLVLVDRDTALEHYGRVYVLPNGNEWFKAAYYKPIHDGSYSLYASGSELDPIQGMTNGWNYGKTNDPASYQIYVWEVGSGAEEQNGTYDMNGNVWEWFETAKDGSSPSGGQRKLHGGGVEWTSEGLKASFSHVDENKDTENSLLGFRVVSISLPPPPPVLRIETTMQIAWTAVSGATYQVQYSTNLLSATWFDLGDPMMTVEITNTIYAATSGVSSCFYRVIVE